MVHSRVNLAVLAAWAEILLVEMLIPSQGCHPDFLAVFIQERLAGRVTILGNP